VLLETVVRNTFGAGHFKIRMNRDDLQQLNKEEMKISEPARAPRVLARL
jgi:hypothetical protein